MWSLLLLGENRIEIVAQVQNRGYGVEIKFPASFPFQDANDEKIRQDMIDHLPDYHTDRLSANIPLKAPGKSS